MLIVNIINFETLGRIEIFESILDQYYGCIFIKTLKRSMKYKQPKIIVINFYFKNETVLNTKKKVKYFRIQHLICQTFMLFI